ncbi:MAG: manganese efflux pump [Clostridia bacterium]|nr:manganese efflux pump [Clostridia bacterium]
MGLIELLFLGVGVSMDAFAVSICKGLSTKRAGARGMLACGLWFGGFQALMPLVGYLLGSLFSNAIERFDHWIAFVLLGFIGVNMLKEAFSKDEECGCCGEGDFSFKTMLTMAVATSIDALAVGVSLAMAGEVNIVLAVTIIGITTFAFSAVGVKIGSVFGNKFEKKAQIAGGVILILLGVKILLEHLGVLPF